MGAVAVVVSGCSPAPFRALTRAEKATDMGFLYTYFNASYAPLQCKASGECSNSKTKFDPVVLQDEYMRRAQNTASNDEFYAVANAFVSEFSDAHTQVSVFADPGRGRTKVAFAGFQGIRVGENFKVTALLPTMKGSGTNFPVAVGDVISKVDGEKLADIVRRDMLKQRNLGNDESNLTYHIPRMFMRSSVLNDLPAKQDLALTMVKAGKESVVTIPWVVKDYGVFVGEQAEAKRKQGPTATDTQTKAELKKAYDIFNFAELLLSGQLDPMASITQKFRQGSPGYRVWDSFTLFDLNPQADAAIFTSAVQARAVGLKLPKEFIAAETPLDELKKERTVPTKAMFVPGATVFPTYVTYEQARDDKGVKVGAPRYVATMYLSTFSPAVEDEKDPNKVLDEKTIVAQVVATVKTLQQSGVNDLVIDMINNGGGSLSLGMRIAQVFSKTKIDVPAIRFGVVPEWEDTFYAESMGGADEAVREKARRIYQEIYDLRTNCEKGGTCNRVTRNFPGDEIMPFVLKGNAELLAPMNVVLLVNEMCASMCDIFAGMMKDNGLATVVGTRTMGAGGNVVTVMKQSPAANFVLSQTQSLIVRKDGSYVENAGVKPDVEIKVVDKADTKYAEVQKGAMTEVLKFKVIEIPDAEKTEKSEKTDQAEKGDKKEPHA